MVELPGFRSPGSAPPVLRSHGFCGARLYNHERLHQAVGYRAPRQAFEEAMPCQASAPEIKRWRQSQASGTIEALKPGRRFYLKIDRSLSQ